MGYELTPEMLDRAIKALEEGDLDAQRDLMFGELPVDMETFMCDDEYMGSGGDTYPNLLKVLKLIDRPEVREVHLNLGKGSGKTYGIARGMLCRGVYMLLCYLDPHATFNLAKGSKILLVNFSTGTVQAQEAIFNELKAGLKNSPWFKGKFNILKKEIEFPNNIKAICGHSAGTTFEGLNIFRTVLDESNMLKDKDGRSNAEQLFQIGVEAGKTRFPGAYKAFSISRSLHNEDFESRKQAEIAKRGTELDLSVLDTCDLPVIE